MKLVIDIDKIVAKGSELSVRGYHSIRAFTPCAKTKSLSFKDRMKAAIKAGVKAAKE